VPAGAVVAMGMPMIDAIRLNMNRVTDYPSTAGSNSFLGLLFPANECVCALRLTDRRAICNGTLVPATFVQKRYFKKIPATNLLSIERAAMPALPKVISECGVWASRKRPSRVPMLITVDKMTGGVFPTSFGGPTHA